MNGFEKRAAEIKRKIVRTTLDMMRQTGSSRIRIADIAKTADVSQVTIYNYFGSKEALLREAFIQYGDDAIRDFEDYMNGGHSLKERIGHLLFNKKQSYRQLPPRLIQELLRDDEELVRHVATLYKDKSVPLAVRMIEEGKASGEIAEDVSVESVLAVLQIYMNQSEQLLEMASRSGDTDTFFEGMFRMFFYGVCGKQPE